MWGEFIGESEAIRKIKELISRIARSDATILIEGETGTGKELLARMIHSDSERSSGVFVPINCSAIPEELLESEMFGYMKGAFTGAVQSKKGLFEAADRGTLFLDEIGDMQLELQAKLLRFIQERQLKPLGTNRVVRVNVRIIAATNRDLKREVYKKKFRMDLYYRLNVIPIMIPPLRKRKDDIPLLVRHFLGKVNHANGKQAFRITRDAMEILLNHDWPGNVRELENVVQRAVLLCDGTIIKKKDIMSFIDFCRNDFIIERDDLMFCLRRNNGNKTKTAQELGISRQWLYRLLKRYDHRGL